MNAAFATAAQSLLGVRYRLHGRDAERGLDCVGLVAAALERAGYPAHAPHGYTMRQADCTPLLGFAARNGFDAVADAGDLVLIMANLIQPHLLVRVPGGFVHAHAGLRRVVLLPGASPWPIAHQWRLRTI